MSRLETLEAILRSKTHSCCGSNSPDENRYIDALQREINTIKGIKPKRGGYARLDTTEVGSVDTSNAGHEIYTNADSLFVY